MEHNVCSHQAGSYYPDSSQDQIYYLCYSFRAEDGIINYKVRLFRMDVINWCDYAGALVLLMCVGIVDPLHIYLSPHKPLERPYVRVSGEATVRHVELFIRRKMELSPTCQVSVCVCEGGGIQMMSQRAKMNTVRGKVNCSGRSSAGRSQIGLTDTPEGLS